MRKHTEKLPPLDGLQVPVPTAEDRVRAARHVKGFAERIGSEGVGTVLAALGLEDVA